MSEILDRYCKKYIDINDETLQRAAIEDPDLLVELLGDFSLRPLTRACVLQDLCAYARDEHWDVCLKLLDDESPFVREASAMSLVQYAIRPNNPKTEVEKILSDKLKTETAVGVMKQLRSCLETIEFYKD